MIKNYLTYYGGLKKTLVAISLLLFTNHLVGQQSYTFTNASASGRFGPSQGQVNTAYLSTNLSGSVLASAGVQYWAVPVSGNYSIGAVGASGGGVNGGYGASMQGDFFLTAGDTLIILVGQMGIDAMDGSTTGGGGSFVLLKNSTSTIVTSSGRSVTPLVIAGGGGGNPGTANAACNGNTGTSGNAGNGATGSGIGGINGNGGGISVPSGNSRGGGGGGFFTNGEQTNTCGMGGLESGLSFLNGGAGGLSTSCSTGYPGGFGGGAGSISSGWRSSGGGGGYSGGGGGQTNSNATTHRGGGGGSFNGGTAQLNTVMTSTGHGRVIISELCAVTITSSTSNSLAPTMCSGNSLTLTTNAVSNFTWSTGNTTNTTIVVSPTSNTTYSIVGTNSTSCQGYGFITVTVSSGLPVLSISNPSNNICLGRTVSLTASGALSYSWTGGVVNGQTFTPSSTTAYTVSGENGCGTSTAVTTITVAPLPVSVLASPSLVCEGYSSSLTAVSAVGNYTWEPGTLAGSTVQVAPMANTIYTVTASDGTCAGTATLEVQTKTTPTITASASATTICEGDAVTLSASGAGVGGTYTWSPGGSNAASFSISPSSSTLFIVNATNSLNCESTAQQVVIVNMAPPLQVTANSTLVCLGNSITLTASGAQTYSWVVGGSSTTTAITINPTGPSVYTVLGTHQTNSCVATRTIAVSAIVPNVTVPSSIAVCSGQSGTIIASGATTYSFNGINSGSNGTFVVSPQVTTNYVLIATTQNTVGTFVNCPSTHSIMVTVNPNPTITVVATKSIICRGETNTLTANGASTYSWSNSTVSGNMITITPTVSSIYTVVGTDANGCEHSILTQAFVSSCNIINENGTLLQSVFVYPNPSNGAFNVKLNAAITLKLINNLGQVIRMIDLNSDNHFSSEVGNLSNGIYFLVGENENGKVNQKIIVAR